MYKVGRNLFGLYLLLKMVIQLAPEYLAYYRKDFHPSGIDYSQQLDYWKEYLAENFQ